MTKPRIIFLRLFLLIAVSVSSFTLLFLRAVDVQWARGTDFRLRADENRYYTIPLPAERGVFLDRYGDPLVWNTKKYYQILDPENIHNAQRPIDRSTALSLMATQSGSVVASMERLYRFPQALAHVLGFTGSVSPDDLLKDRTLDITDQIGKTGLEANQNIALRGLDGKEIYEINALGQRQKLVEQDLAIPGANAQTTLDPYLSEVAYRALNQAKGGVVILDGQSGEVLAMVNSPSFDPNILTRTADSPQAEQQRKAQLQTFFQDPRQLFFDRVADGAYPLGSVFKLVTALAGLETGAIDTSTIVDDQGVLKVGQYEYGNWLYREYGRTDGQISLVKALARSNDIYFYKAAEFTGPDQLAQMANLMGLGQTTSLEIQPQTAGLVPTPDWKQRVTGNKWFLGDTYHFGIGQGDLLVSPIQVAQMVQTVANSGTRCPPKLLTADKQACIELSLKQENLDSVLQGMLDACSTGGTAFPFFPYNTIHRLPDKTPEEEIANGAIACKTGTAEFGAADSSGRKQTHGWFVADWDWLPQEADLSPTSSVPVATVSATVAEPTQLVTDQTDLQTLRQTWLQHLAQKPLPKNLIFVVLVESDETKPFKEGSADAAPVVKQIIEWMMGKKLAAPAVVAPGAGE